MLIATEGKVYRLSSQGDRGPEQSQPSGQRPPRGEVVFESEGLCRVAGRGKLIVVAIEEEGVVLLPGGQAQPTVAVDEPVESLLILAVDPPEVLVGTEGAHLLRLRAGLAERIAAFDALECRSAWYTPWGGPPAVRSLAATPDGWLYADIHVGSIMRSPDRGRTWHPVTPELHEDVHQVATCPAAPGRVYANTARAFYLSEDHGQSWQHRADDLGCRYGRALAVCPYDPELVLATVSDGPHGDNVHGQLYRTDDAGRSWQHLAGAFPASTPDNIDTFRVAFTADGLAWAAVDNTLYVGRDHATRWEPFWSSPTEEPIIMIDPCEMDA